MKITDGGGVHHNDRGANHNAWLLWYAPGGLIITIKLLLNNITKFTMDYRRENVCARHAQNLLSLSAQTVMQCRMIDMVLH